jgi:2-iminobutanoate/2-iminopropanoate deaminase
MEILSSSKAPQAIGPYSQAIKSGGFIFCSGQIPLNANGEIVGTTIEEQATQILENIKNLLSDIGSDVNKIVKTTIFLTDVNDFPKVNEIYGKYITHKPARSTIVVASLPKGVKLEIECIAEV